MIKKYQKILLIITIIIVYATTAYFSSGYHHADEHYQIIEFASYKLGNIEANQLAWEYNAKLRSSIQPWIAVGGLGFLQKIGVSNPYTQMFIFRLLSALFSVLAMLLFYKALIKRRIIKIEYKKYFLAVLLFLWFIPYLSVRFSPETWSVNFFLIAISIYLIKNKISFKNLFVVGLLLGLAFLFRFQTGVLIFSFVMWVLIIDKIKLKQLLYIFLGGIIAISFGILLDYLFYNEFAISWVNYFKFNILEGKSSEFGTEPWWRIIKYFYKYPTYPIGLVFVLSLMYFLIKHVKSLFTFLIIPFIIILMVIPHKELRFLFPIAIFAPVVAFIFISDAYLFIKTKKILKYITIMYISFILIVNSAALVVFAVKSPEVGLMGLTEYVYNNYRNEKVHIFAKKWHNPYNQFGLPLSFYLTNNITYSEINDDTDINSIKNKQNTINLMTVNSKYYLENKELLNKKGFYILKKGVPDWIMFLNKYQKGIQKELVTYLLIRK